MKRIICIFLMFSALFLLVSCADFSSVTSHDPDGDTTGSDSTNESLQTVDPLSKISFFFGNRVFVPGDIKELQAVVSSMYAVCADGNAYRSVSLRVYGEGNTDPTLASYLKAQGLSYESSAQSNIDNDYGVAVIAHSTLASFDPAVLLTAASHEGIDRIEILPGAAALSPFGNDAKTFPDYTVSVGFGSKSVRIHDSEDLKSWLSVLEALCAKGTAYDGIGIYLYGIELSEDFLAGNIRYSTLSYGHAGKTATVLGVKSDLISDIDAALLTSNILLSRHFDSVEIRLIKDIQSSKEKAVSVMAFDYSNWAFRYGEISFAAKDEGDVTDELSNLQALCAGGDAYTDIQIEVIGKHLTKDMLTALESADIDFASYTENGTLLRVLYTNVKSLDRALLRSAASEQGAEGLVFSLGTPVLAINEKNHLTLPYGQIEIQLGSRNVIPRSAEDLQGWLDGLQEICDNGNAYSEICIFVYGRELSAAELADFDHQNIQVSFDDSVFEGGKGTLLRVGYEASEMLTSSRFESIVMQDEITERVLITLGGLS